MKNVIMMAGLMAAAGGAAAQDIAPVPITLSAQAADAGIPVRVRALPLQDPYWGDCGHRWAVAFCAQEDAATCWKCLEGGPDRPASCTNWPIDLDNGTNRITFTPAATGVYTIGGQRLCPSLFPPTTATAFAYTNVYFKAPTLPTRPNPRLRRR